MNGLMMNRPLLISSLIEHADAFHGTTEIVSRTIEGPIHRYTYRDAHTRAKQLANALRTLGVKPGDRIGTIAWNGYRHFEIYFAVSGMGAICHTINPRLFPDQLTYIINHAEDSYLFVDLTFVPLIEKLAEHIKAVKGIIVMTDAAHMPPSKLTNLLCYEDLLAKESADYTWPEFDENTASSLCYTSGTTGNPKGVLYSHRSTVLHSFAACATDGIGLSSRDAVLPVVPMFHVNAWGIPYAAPMTGAKIVFPGAGMDGASLAELINQEKATLLLGVPTIWLMLLNHLRDTQQRIDSVKNVVIGGSAAPQSMIETFQQEYGATVLHAWGMTEMSPLGTMGRLLPKHDGLAAGDKLKVQLKQGRGMYGVELKIVDDKGERLPHDGKAFGNLMVRGPWITRAYYRGEGGQVLDAEGFFPTGDVSTIDPDGYMQITDRSKDVIKSGGEWISSIELENVAVGCPGVAEAAVIGIAHPKWDERPLLIIARKAGSEVSKEEILTFMQGKIATWWMPDDVVFVNELPHTATGKLLKTALREQFKDYVLPTAQV
jgi:fatty-acyl-CoA synthase